MARRLPKATTRTMSDLTETPKPDPAADDTAPSDVTLLDKKNVTKPPRSRARSKAADAPPQAEPQVTDAVTQSNVKVTDAAAKPTRSRTRKTSAKPAAAAKAGAGKTTAPTGDAAPTKAATRATAAKRSTTTAARTGTAQAKPASAKPAAAQSATSAERAAKPAQAKAQSAEAPPPPRPEARTDAEPASQPTTPPTGEAAKPIDAKAKALVERYALYGGAGGVIPFPLVDSISVFAVQLSLAKALADHYGVPFQKDRARAFLYASLGTAAPLGAEAVVSGVLGRATPVGFFAGLTVSGITAAMATRRIGWDLMERFAAGNAL